MMEKKLFFTLLTFVGITFSTNLLAQTTPTILGTEQFGGVGADIGYGITTDTSGNVYTTGQFSGTVTFGTIALTSTGSTDVFVTKTDASGTILWAKQLGGTGADIGRGISTDTEGNIYVTGNFSGTATFEDITLTSAGSSDVFVVKTDSTGTVLWAESFGGTGVDTGHSITTDNLGNIYVTGNFSSTATFAGTVLTTYGGNDIFVAKINPAGTVLWAEQFGGTGADIGRAVSTDTAGNVYVTGNFSGTATFGSEDITLTSAGGNDIFLAKIDLTGTVLWAEQFGGTGADIGYGITTDIAENIYITGQFQGTATFGSITLTSSGFGFNNNTDVFVVKIDPTGTVLWAERFGGLGGDTGHGITTDIAGNVYVTGQFTGTAGSDTASFGDITLTYAGSYDVFIAKTDTSGTVLWAEQLGGTSEDNGRGLAVDTTGNVYGMGNFSGTVAFGNTTLTSAGGSDVFIVKVCEPTTETFTHTACDAYTWIDGITYTESNNTATYTEVNENSCDNVITLDLTINYSTTETFTHTTCDVYTWIDGITYVESNNTATYTEMNEDGCDNVITLDLTIINVDNTISQSGAELTANQEGATYQWFYNDSAIEGATSQSFTATQNGTFYVEVTLGECTVTSEGIVVSGLSIGQNKPSGLSVYPNPVSDILYLTSNTKINDFSVFNILGQKLNIATQANNTQVNMSGLPTGNYVIRVNIEGITKTFKIVKQ